MSLRTLSLPTKKSLLIAICSLFTILSFSQEFRTSHTGLKFNIIKDAPGSTAKLGDFVSLHMKMQNPDGSIIKNSFGQKPILFPIKVSGFEGDIYEAVAMLSKGDSAQFLLSADSTYQITFHKPVPESIKPSEQISLTVVVLDIKTEQEHMTSLLEEREQKLKELDSKINEHKTSDRAKIKTHITSNELYFEEAETGLFYEIMNEGNGELASEGKSVTFHIECKLFPNGEMIESTIDSDPVFITINSNRTETIPGVNEALKMLKPGGKGNFILPAHLGYSYLPKDKIPPFSILEVYIELIAVR